MSGVCSRRTPRRMLRSMYIFYAIRRPKLSANEPSADVVFSASHFLIRRDMPQNSLYILT
jgi:hypothetical protein